jgi:hypothetical protein
LQENRWMREGVKKILVAFQDEALAVFLSEALVEEAYKVVLCSDAGTLFRDIRRFAPQLVLMDEEFGGAEKNFFRKMVSVPLDSPPLIILWRGNRPKSCRNPAVGEGFALKSSNLGHLKQKIASVLGESVFPNSRSRLERVPLPFTQTVFEWVKVGNAVDNA